MKKRNHKPRDRMLNTLRRRDSRAEQKAISAPDRRGGSRRMEANRNTTPEEIAALIAGTRDFLYGEKPPKFIPKKEVKKERKKK